ncbi:hypothetical protein JVU11DRAFT_10549 [Chiua virens]|nr:hypothetical protein JVU11DRAFT_10549 [Chiua virens]
MHDEHFRKALEILRDGHVGLLDFLLGILDPTKREFVRYRNSFFANASGKLDNMLDRIFKDDKGCGVLLV